MEINTVIVTPDNIDLLASEIGRNADEMRQKYEEAVKKNEVYMVTTWSFRPEESGR